MAFVVESKVIPGLRLSRYASYLGLRLRRTFSTLSNESDESSNINHAERKPGYNPNVRFQYPELLPDPNPKWRNIIREKLEREDMLNRRRNIDIPEFYVGSILAVTTADRHAVNKINRFLGICVQREGQGLRAWFSLRNVVDHQGVEVRYDLYSPLLHKIEVIRLEKRLDSSLLYLRDAPNEYSTFPFDMEPEYHPPGAPVPINTVKVKINPRPWLARYERMNLQGVELPELHDKLKRLAIMRAKPWEKYDLMDHYRQTVPEEEQREVFSEVLATLEELESKRKTIKRKRTYVKPESFRPM